MKKTLLLDDSFDPDNNIFNTHGFANTTYFITETLKTMIEVNNDISFSVRHVNVRTFKKNFESLKNLLVELNFCFKMTCLAESWCSNDLHTNN